MSPRGKRQTGTSQLVEALKRIDDEPAERVERVEPTLPEPKPGPVSTVAVVKQPEAKNVSSGRRVRILRDGVWSEKGEHNKGDEIETEGAALLIERGFAEPV